jgi:hypothetical protein
MHKKLSLSELARNTQHYVCHYYNSFQNPITHFDRFSLFCKRRTRHIHSEGTVFSTAVLQRKKGRGKFRKPGAPADGTAMTTTA